MAVVWLICTTLVIGVNIGMSQAAEGDIRLTGSDRRIEGKLQIEHNGVWRSACYDDWTHEDASTACKQLGYSKGAMIFKADNGEFGGSSNPTLRNLECTSSSDRLTDCPSFQYQENLSCSSDVIMSCYVDEFRGCYLNLPISNLPLQLLPAGTTYSIQTCLTFCRLINLKFASLAGARCYCLSDDASLQDSSIISTSLCSESCTADNLQACGMTTGTNGTTGNYAVWPVTAGASSGSLITAEGCLYSPDFPGRYKTSSDPSTNTYTVTLPSRAYVSLSVKMLDVADGDRVQFQDTTSGSAMAAVILTEPSVPGSAVLPVQSRVSTFSISFHIAEDSPNMENYGFIICYESLDALPPDPTTRPTPEPTTKAPTPAPTEPPTLPPVVPPTVIPTTTPPEVLTNPPVVTTMMALMPTTPEEAMTTTPPIVTTMPKLPTTIDNRDSEVCPAYQGDSVESRPGRGPNNMLLINTGNPFNCTGFITSVSLYSVVNEMFVLSVWRPQHGTNSYKYMISGQAQVQGSTPGVATVSIPADDWLTFMPGDVMGVRVQTSPLVFSDMAALPGDPMPWMSWELDDGSEPSTVLDVRDSIRATGLNYSYSLFASIKAKDRCYIPIVDHVKFIDAVTAYVYEREAYTLQCRGGYVPRGGNVFTCQAGGNFDRPLICDDDGVIFRLTWTDIIILCVVLVLLFFTVLIGICTMLCCCSSSKGGSHGAKADKAPEAAVAAPADSFDEADAALDDGDISDDRFLISIHDDESEGIPNTETDSPHVYDNRDPTAAADDAVTDAAAADAAAAEAAAADAVPETEGTAVMDNPVHNMADDSSQ